MIRIPRKVLSFTVALGLSLVSLACGSSGAVAQNGNTSVSSQNGGGGELPAEFLAEAKRFVERINVYRAEKGLESLRLSITLTRNAQWMAEDMAKNNYMAHTDSLGRDYAKRMADFGYPVASAYTAENVAAGNETAEQTFEQWRSSPGHDRNMLNPRLRALGIGRAHEPGSRFRWYWSTTFGSRLDTDDSLELETPAPLGHTR